MKLLIAVLCLAFATTGALAQDKKDAKKEPTAAQKAQQEKMKDCNAKAGDKKGDDRKKFMSSCLSGGKAEPTPAQKAQQERMTACNKQATEKKLKGDERKKFMSSCLKS
ncbi:MAG: phosphate-starvation-inducible protein PsiF [Betaproteobacteria bacterium]|nr:phosphate-starvation-inducible protein PsiF [Betaproteobacteria bacterium]